MSEKTEKQTNPLSTAPVGKLLAKFAVPSIISMLVGALYNVVDQIFIGQGVGMLGNAATNVAFPLVTIATSMALLVGIGAASGFSLALGANNRDGAARIAANGISWLVIFGLALCAITLVFLQPLMLAFGATETVLPYALTYTGITAFGTPFLLFSTGGSHLVRADGSPVQSMICVLSGAVLNTILDPLLIFTFGMGIAGAAYATVAGQILSAVLVARYLTGFRTVPLQRAYLRPTLSLLRRIASLGMAASFNQLAITVVQITMNNTLTHYGAQSDYGADIPLAVVGVISKVNILYMALVIGIAQGCQPIFGFNYGAKNYGRVKQTYRLAVIVASVISIAAFLCFQLFPHQITAVFGTGSPLYFQFAERYFRIFMLLAFLNGLQPITSNFFTSIGKATRGILLSLTRQIIFLLPLLLLLPRFFGIEGVLFAGPVADGAAALVAVFLVWNEMRKMGKEPVLARASG